MVKVRTAKSKGSSFEYNCQYSLRHIFSDLYRTSERGFQMQFDLCSDIYNVAIECKRLKGISWNQLVKFYEKLVKVTPDYKRRYLLFQSNRQPCLVFMREDDGMYVIRTFGDVFDYPFEKHKSTRVREVK